MVPKQVDLALELLKSSEIQDNLKGVRKLKNLVIGNRTNKRVLLELDILPNLVRLLLNTQLEEEHKVQLIVIIGSLAHGNPQCVDRLFKSNITQTLIQLLASNNQPRLIESSARTLRIIFQNNKVSRSLSKKECELILYTLDLAHHTSSASLEEQGMTSQQVSESSLKLRIAEITAGIIARIVPVFKNIYTNDLHRVLKVLTHYLKLEFIFYPKLQEAILDALASLCKEWTDSCSIIVNMTLDANTDCLGAILSLARSKRSSMRLLACTCLTNLVRSQYFNIPQQQHEIALYILPILIKLFQDTTTFENTAGYGSTTIQEKAPLVLAHLVGENEVLQKWAKDADAITKLSEIIEATHDADIVPEVPAPPSHPFNLDIEKLFPKPRIVHSSVEKRRESALLAIASVCSLSEECRKQVIEAKLLVPIVNGLSHANVGIRAAACNCTRSLSRSVKNLRTALVDAGVAIPLMKLLSNENNQVKITASATLCNIVLDFSPMKKTVLENGGVELLVSLIRSTEKDLRLNTVWALKNLLYQADSEIKTRVMSLLGWNELEVLLSDPHPNIREQALNLLRNLACGKESDIQQVFDGFGDAKLIDLIGRVLMDSVSSDEITLQALYTIVNIVTGTDEHKNMIMSNETISKRIGFFLGHPKSSVRIAAVWCIINLTWKDDATSAMRIQKLVELGIETQLQSMKDDQDVDVRDRVKTALSHFHVDGNLSAGGGSSNSSLSWLSSSGLAPILQTVSDGHSPVPTAPAMTTTTSSGGTHSGSTAARTSGISPRRMMNLEMEDTPLNRDTLMEFTTSFDRQLDDLSAEED